jgi:hypothetical protein
MGSAVKYRLWGVVKEVLMYSHPHSLVLISYTSNQFAATNTALYVLQTNITFIYVAGIQHSAATFLAMIVYMLVKLIISLLWTFDGVCPMCEKVYLIPGLQKFPTQVGSHLPPPQIQDRRNRKFLVRIEFIFFNIRTIDNWHINNIQSLSCTG